VGTEPTITRLRTSLARAWTRPTSSPGLARLDLAGVLRADLVGVRHHQGPPERLPAELSDQLGDGHRLARACGRDHRGPVDPATGRPARPLVAGQRCDHRGYLLSLIAAQLETGHVSSSILRRISSRSRECLAITFRRHFPEFICELDQDW